MRISIRTATVVVFLLGLGVVSASEDSFEENFAKAKANVATEQGAAYDAALGAAYEAMPDFKPKVEECLRASPGPHVVRGYFLFLSKQDFAVILEPKDEFTSCLSQALASPSVPPPPSVPYLNPFTFTLQP